MNKNIAKEMLHILWRNIKNTIPLALILFLVSAAIVGIIFGIGSLLEKLLGSDAVFYTFFGALCLSILLWLGLEIKDWYQKAKHNINKEKE